MKLRVIFLGLILCAPLYGQTYELPCPAGTSPIQYHQSYNSATSAFRQWACVDKNGSVTLQGTSVTNGASGIDVSTLPGTDLADKVNACIALLPSAGGTCDARNLSGTQAMGSSIVLGSDAKPIHLILPPATITRALNAEFKYYNGSWVEGQGNCNGGYYSTCTAIIGAGDTAFIRGGTSHSGYVHLDNFYVAQSGAGTVAIDFTHAIKSTIQDVSALSNSGTALIVGGTGDCACYNEFRGNDFRGGQYGVQLLDTSNQNNFYGGTIWSGGTAVYQNSGVNGSGVNNFYGVDMENSGIGYDIDGYNDMILNPYIEAVTTPFKLKPGTTGVWIQGFGVTAGSITDNSGNTQNFYMGFDLPNGSAGKFPLRLAFTDRLLIGGNSWGNTPTNEIYSLNNVYTGGYTPYDDISLQYEGGPQSYGFLGHAGLDISRLIARDTYTWGLTTQQVGKPAAPTLTCSGSGTGTSYSYYMVGNTRSGGSTLPSNAATIQCPNAPSASHPITIIPSVLTGAWSDVWMWDVLKTNTATSLCTNVRFGANAANCKDTGQATSAYPTPTRDSTADITVAGYINGNKGMLSNTVTLTAAQVNALNATPITIVPAAGANLKIIPITAEIDYTYGSAAFTITSVPNFAMQFIDQACGIYNDFERAATGLLDQAQNMSIGGYITGLVEAPTPTSNLINEDLQVCLDGGSTSGGTGSTVTIQTWYTVQ